MTNAANTARTTTPCTITFRVPAKVRGGKGFEARYQAEETARAAHAAQYCGAVTDTLHWGAAGSMRNLTARPEAELFAASCTMPEALGTPQRFVPAAVMANAVNHC